MDFYVYILTNKYNTVSYIGVTNDLERRLSEHKLANLSGFSHKYKLTKLIYYEVYPDPISAISRKKQLKNWHRDWKWNLIKAENPELKDLSDL